MSVFSKFCIAAVAVATQGALADGSSKRAALKVSGEEGTKKVTTSDNKDLDLGKVAVGTKFQHEKNEDKTVVESYEAKNGDATEVTIGKNVFKVDQHGGVKEARTEKVTFEPETFELQLTSTETVSTVKQIKVNVEHSGDESWELEDDSKVSQCIGFQLPEDLSSVAVTSSPKATYSMTLTADGQDDATVVMSLNGEKKLVLASKQSVKLPGAPSTKPAKAAARKVVTDAAITTETENIKLTFGGVEYTGTVTETPGEGKTTGTLMVDCTEESQKTSTVGHAVSKDESKFTVDDEEVLALFTGGEIAAEFDEGADFAAVTQLLTEAGRAKYTEAKITKTEETAAVKAQWTMQLSTAAENVAGFKKDVKQLVTLEQGDDEKWSVVLPTELKEQELNEKESKFTLEFHNAEDASDILTPAALQTKIIAVEATHTWYMVAAPKTDKKSLMQEPLFWGLIAAALAVVLVIFFMVCKGDSSESDDESDSSDSDFSDDESDAEAAKSDAGAASGASTPKNNDA